MSHQTPPSVLSVPARFIATAGGAGYSPIAPGTCGTIVAIPFAVLAAPLPLWGFVAVTVAITVIGIIAADLADRTWGTHDSGRIVIDEAAGYFVGLCFVDPSRPSFLLLGFIAFRAFDITKPPPVRAIDHKMPGGFGVVLDDVGAGIYAGLLLLALRYTGLPAWIDRWF